MSDLLNAAINTVGNVVPGLGAILAAGNIAGWFGWSFPTDATGITLAIGNALSNFLLTSVNFFFFWLGYIAAQAINIFAVLNPFDANTLAPFIWNTFRNISYVGIIFFSLYTGFLWIIGRDGPAKELLTKLLIVALVMNFSFLFAREIYAVGDTLTNSLARFYCSDPNAQTCHGVGTAIHTSLTTFVQESVLSPLQSNTAGTGLDPHSQLAFGIVFKLIGISLFLIYTVFMSIIAMLFVGRFVLITLLVGLLPLAVIAWATPWHKGQWDKWWQLFIQWTVNIPVFLLLVLIGFSIVSATTSLRIGGWPLDDALTRLQDPLLANASGAGGATIASIGAIIRFGFVAVYYAVAIGIAQSLGGGFAKFGINFAKGSWMTIGGATVGAGKWGFRKTVAQPLANRLDSAGDKMLERGIGQGQLLKNVAEGLKKSKKEDTENTIKAELKKALKEKDSDTALQNLILKHQDNAVAMKTILGSEDVNKDTNDWVRLMNDDRMASVFRGKREGANRAIFGKKSKAFSATSKDEAAEAYTKLDPLKVGSIKTLHNVLREDIRGTDGKDVFRASWEDMTDTKKRQLAASKDGFTLLRDFDSDLLMDEQFRKGFIKKVQIRDLMKTSFGKAIEAIQKGEAKDLSKANGLLGDIARGLGGLDPARKAAIIGQIRAELPDAGERAAISSYLEEILTDAPTDPAGRTGINPDHKSLAALGLTF